jgi:hypothetical protein
MSPLGKIVTAGIAVVTGTSLLTGVTTAYILRPPVPAAPMTATYASTPLHQPPAGAAGRVVPAVTRTTPNTPRAVPVAAASSQCATGADRAWRIAKPGALGGLVGAALGAAGGAIADGGSGAGKGALIGGLAGAATGAGYGAYETNTECGTIFGNRGFTDGGSETALRTRAANDITIYSGR